MSANQPYDQQQLLSGIAGGDKEAFKRLYDLHRQRIFSLAFHITKSAEKAEDVVQDIFLKLWVNRQQLPGIDNFDAYLHSITRNHLYNQYKRQALEATYAYILKAEFDGQTQTLFPDPAIYSDLKRIYGEAISKLSRQQRRVYIMGKQEGMKYEEIAAALNISRDTVKDHMSAALQTIREHVKGYDYEIGCLFLASAILAA